MASVGLKKMPKRPKGKLSIKKVDQYVERVNKTKKENQKRIAAQKKLDKLMK